MSVGNGSQGPALEFKDVERLYPGRGEMVRALGPVSLVVERGEMVAVMGPSGSGKSTLLALAGALDRPSSGAILLEGTALGELDPKRLSDLRRQRVGSVFQEFNLLPGLNSLENVALPLELDGVRPRRSREEAMRALGEVGLGKLAQRFPDDLSGGERQRVAIARALIGPRELILADEPTGALDSVTGERIMRLLRDLCDRGRTVLVATHNASHAAWADRVLFLRDGRVVEAGQETSGLGGKARP